MEKDPRDVIHESHALEAYLDAYFDEVQTTFEQWVERFGDSFYRSRNQTIVAMLKPRQPRRILELACAGGFLAQALMDDVQSIEAYTCTNFSARMVDFCARQLADYPQCSVQLLDADVVRSADLARAELDRYDAVLTTSFEHIQFDRELIASLPPGQLFLFSVAAFDDPEHFRVFENADEIRARYAGLLEVLDLRANLEGNKWVVLTRTAGRI